MAASHFPTAKSIFSRLRVLRFAVGCVSVLLFLSAGAVAQTSPSPFAVLHSFTKATDGSGAPSRLIEASNGMLYGTNHMGGSFNGGTLFRINKGGAGFTVLKHFAPADGANPITLLQARNGRLYGLCSPVGTTQSTLFSIGLDGGEFTVLRRFAPVDSWLPITLVEAANGQLYGIARSVSSFDDKALFRINADGSSFTLVRTLAEIKGSLGVSMIPGPDGRFYCTYAGLLGTTQINGVAAPAGGVFVVNADGSALSVLKRFQNSDGHDPNRLAIVNGELVGTTQTGGSEGSNGVLFRMGTNGSGFTVLHEFRGTFPPAAGEIPFAGVTPLADGSLCGVTFFGGNFRGFGTLYRYDPAARRMIFLKQFNQEDGIQPSVELLAASDGRLYGVTAAGGAQAAGTLYSYDMSLPGANVGLIATVGQPFSHNHGFGTSATGLPAGLAVIGLSGLIAGTPTQAGTFQVTVTGPVSASIASNTITLTVAKGAATVTLGNLSQNADGTAKTPSVTTVPAGLSVSFTYAGSSSAPSSAGSYPVVATITDPNYVGSTTGTLVLAASAPRFNAPLANVSAVAGNAVTLQAEVSATSPLTFKWQGRPRGQETFVDLTEGAIFTGVASGTLVIKTPTTAMQGDQFRVVVSSAGGSITSEPATLFVRPGSVLANVSVRALVTPSEELTVGVVTSGSRSLLLRGVGPGLVPFIGTGAAGDPSLVVSNSGNPRLDQNDNWNGAPALVAAFTKVGAFTLPSDSQDAAVLTPVDGAITARLSVRSAGLALIEAYDAGTGDNDRLVNLSALHVVGAGAESLVAGFNISGTGTKTLLLRGIGPALRAFGVSDPIEDPRLQVFQGATQLAFNDDWPESLGATFNAVGAFSLGAGSKDAVLLLTLAPGSYTIQLSNIQNRAGPGLIEIYEVP